MELSEKYVKDFDMLKLTVKQDARKAYVLYRSNICEKQFGVINES